MTDSADAKRGVCGECGATIGSGDDGPDCAQDVIERLRQREVSCRECGEGVECGDVVFHEGAWTPRSSLLAPRSSRVRMAAAEDWPDLTGHTYGPACRQCTGEHGQPARCDLQRYGERMARFVLAHLEVYAAAYVSWGAQSIRNQLERLEAEYKGLPRYHACTCWASHCAECRRIDSQRPIGKDVAVELGRTAMVNPPVPEPTVLDLFMATCELRAKLKRRPTVHEVVGLLNEGGS